MSCLCLNNCLFRRKYDTKLLMQTNIQDIKQKQRSVFKAPRSHSKKEKKTTKSSSTIKKTTTPEWKNKFRCLLNKEDNNNESSLHCSLKYYLSSSFDSSSQEEKEINISGDNLPRITKRAITETQIEWKLQKCRTKRRSIYYTNDGTLVNLLKTKTNNNLCCYDYSGDYFNRKRNTICLLRPIAHPGHIANKNNVIKKEK